MKIHRQFSGGLKQILKKLLPLLQAKKIDTANAGVSKVNRK
jgi:hypothetical protein